MILKKILASTYNIHTLTEQFLNLLTYDSDSDHQPIEDSEDEMRIASFPVETDSKRKTRATATTIWCKDGQIKGGYLLYKTNSLIRSFIEREAEYRNDSVCFIQEGINWLQSAGRLAGPKVKQSINQTEIFKLNGSGTIAFKSDDFCDDSVTEMKLVRSERTERLYWNNKDYSYKNIANILKEFSQKVKVYHPYSHEKVLLSDSLIAKILLCKISDGEWRIEVKPPFYKSEVENEVYDNNFVNDFLNFLSTLMIGIEGSRNNISMITSIMALELVKYDKFSFEQMFHDDAYGYGGQYSMANRKLSGPKFKNYRAVLENAENVGINGGSLRQERKEQLFAVPVKDIVTIKNWLKMKNIQTRLFTISEFLGFYECYIQEIVEKYYYHTPGYEIR